MDSEYVKHVGFKIAQAVTVVGEYTIYQDDSSQVEFSMHLNNTTGGNYWFSNKIIVSIEEAMEECWLDYKKRCDSRTES